MEARCEEFATGSVITVAEYSWGFFCRSTSTYTEEAYAA